MANGPQRLASPVRRRAAAVVGSGHGGAVGAARPATARGSARARGHGRMPRERVADGALEDRRP